MPLGATAFTSVSWTVGDVITEAKLDYMTNNDRAYDSHATQGILLNNDRGVVIKDSGGTNREVMNISSADVLKIGNDDVSTVLSTGLLNAIYPIGSIYTSVVSTNPGSLFGGTWEAFGAGRVIVGYDSGDTDFDTAEKTGGAKTHKHKVASPVGYIAQYPVIFNSGEFADILGDRGEARDVVIENRIRHEVSTSASGNTEVWNLNTTEVSGLQPYITVYMWKRTA